DQRDRHGAGAGRSDAIAVDQRPRALAYAVTLGIALRPVERVIGGETMRLERLPQRLDAEILRRKAGLRQCEVDRPELRLGAAQVGHQLALMRQRLSQRVWQDRVGEILRSAREWIRIGVLGPGQIEAVEAGLRDHHGPVRVTTTRLVQHPQHATLYWI